MRISALYLAAGTSSRMGQRKQAIELGTYGSLGAIALHALPVKCLEKVAVVVHPDDPLEWLVPSLDSLSAASFLVDDPFSSDSIIQAVVCEQASEGMSNSIRCGLELLIADTADLDAVIVVLADQPFITSEMIERLITRLCDQPELDYVASAIVEMVKGESVITLMPPAVLSRSMFQSMLQLTGDAGARRLFQLSSFSGCAIPAEDQTTLMDIDSPIDLEYAIKTLKT